MPDIRYKIFLKREGVLLSDLELPKGESTSINCINDAEIKMSIDTFVLYNSIFDYNNDRLVPVVSINGTDYNLGEFIISSSHLVDDGLNQYYRLTGFDLTYLAKRMKTETRLFFSQGTLYTTAIRFLLIAVGYTRFLIEPSNFTFQVDREDWEPGTSYLEIINTLLQEINYNSVYMDLEGTINIREFKQPNADNVDISYYNDPKTSIIVPGSTIDIDAFDHPNIFYYSSENIDNDTILNAMATNDNPGNKFSIQRQGRIAEFVKINNVPNQSALNSIANKAMLQSMISSDIIQFNTEINPVHNPFSIIALRKNEFTGILLEQEWRIVFNLEEPMYHSAKRVTYD